MADAPVRVVGLGNVLMGDDGFGPWVIHHLGLAYSFPPEIALIDAGTPGSDLVPHLYDADVVLFVDTVRSTGAPGELRRYDKSEILRHPPSPRVSPHDPGLKEALLALDFVERGPREVILIGAIPGPIVKQRTSLSPALREAVPWAAQAIVTELARLGFKLGEAKAVDIPDPWWETAVESPPT